MDGHGSHISIEIIELAQWPHSVTPLNIMSRFKKSGIYPLNPSEVTDRQVAPSKPYQQQSKQSSQVVGSVSESPTSSSTLFSPDKVELYKKRYEEGYNVGDPDYVAWLKINYPTEICSNATKSSVSSISGALLKEDRGSSDSGKSKLASGDALSEILVFPCPLSRPKSDRKPALNAKTVCITDDSAAEELKREAEKAKAEKEKEAKKIRVRKGEAIGTGTEKERVC